MRITKTKICLFLLIVLCSLALNFLSHCTNPPQQIIQREGSPIAMRLTDSDKVKTLHSDTNYTSNSSQVFRIYYWTKYTSSKSTNNWFGLGLSPFEKCEYKNCLTTNDPADYNSSDVVLFYIFHAKSLPS